MSQPELVWPGKQPVVTPSDCSLEPVDLVTSGRSVRSESTGAWVNRLIWGDNLRAMAALLKEYRGQVALIYLDPPFDTGVQYRQRVPVGDSDSGRPPLELAAPVYRDAWGGHGRAGYLQMLYERLTLAHALLADGGAIYVHVDPTVSPYVRLILDEIFGPTAFQREIVWRIGWVSGYKSAAANWVRNHDSILYYAKGHPAIFNKPYLPYPPNYRRRTTRGSSRGYPLEDVWNASPLEHALQGAESLDSIQIKSFSTEKTGFPTQKNESLLSRIVRASSNPGDLVADFFCGSGTTLAVADQLGRRWIGCDEAWRAIHTTRKRLLMRSGGGTFLVERSGAGVPCAVRYLEADRPAPGEIRVWAHADVRGAEVTVTLDRYHPAAATRAQFQSEGRPWADYVDYWAVDFTYDGELFRDEWRSFRTRARPRLDIASPARPSQGQVALRVVDVFGAEATVRLDTGTLPSVTPKPVGRS